MDRSDEQIQRDVHDMLVHADRFEIHDLKVEVIDGNVTLHGMVPDAGEFARIEDLVADAAGVASVDNKLGAASGSQRSFDDELARSIASTVENHPDLEGADIGVSVRSDNVILSGTAPRVFVRDKAAVLADRNSGARRVVNRVLVVPNATSTDVSIAREVLKNLDETREVSAEEISVRVDDGTVTLTGAVPTWVERSAAVRAATIAAGDSEVIDQIRTAEIAGD